MKPTDDKMALPEDPTLVRIVDTSSAFDEVWEAFCVLFGEPTSPTRALQAKIVRELSERGADGDEVIRRAGAMAALWGPQRVTVTSLFKHWGRFDGSISTVDESGVERHRSDERYRRLASEGGP